MSYSTFLKTKDIADERAGLDQFSELNPQLFDFQKDIVKWALNRGRACVFADCGMGKTPMQLEWASKIPGRVLIAAPLAVSSQTVSEAHKFNIDGVKYLRKDDGGTPIVVTNYEMMDNFSPSDFEGVVLDESSILKSYTGKFRNYLIEEWASVPYRLAATATPAPNDLMELGNHSEFMGAMSRAEMLSMFFVHDGGETQKWRLKGHAEDKFWDWVCSWAVTIRKPSDLGYEDGQFKLPDLHINQVTVDAKGAPDGMLFPMDAHTLQERQGARRSSLAERVDAVADMVNGSSEKWVVWCDRNDESTALKKAIEGSVEVKGSDSPDSKSNNLNGFSNGNFRVLVSKPSIAGWGMNWQHCSHMAFTGLSDSYEQFYQAVRRCWRFGQKRPVNCYVVTSSTEGAVVNNIKRKEDAAELLVSEMAGKTLSKSGIRNRKEARRYAPTKSISVPSWIK